MQWLNSQVLLLQWLMNDTLYSKFYTRMRGTAHLLGGGAPIQQAFDQGVNFRNMSSDLTLVLHLTCSTTGESADVDLSLASLPSVGLDLKREIERAHDIPVFAQTLSYGESESESALMADDDAIHRALLRDGDRLRVSYTSKADCKDVQRALQHLENLLISFQREFPAVSTSSSAILLTQAFGQGIAQLLRIVSLAILSINC